MTGFEEEQEEEEEEEEEVEDMSPLLMWTWWCNIKIEQERDCDNSPDREKDRREFMTKKLMKCFMFCVFHVVSFESQNSIQWNYFQWIHFFYICVRDDSSGCHLFPAFVRDHSTGCSGSSVFVHPERSRTGPYSSVSVRAIIWLPHYFHFINKVDLNNYFFFHLALKWLNLLNT